MVAIIQEKQRVFIDRFIRYESRYSSYGDFSFVGILTLISTSEVEPQPSAFCLHAKKYPSRLFEGWFDEWGQSPDIATVVDNGKVSAIKTEVGRMVEVRFNSVQLRSDLINGELW